MSTLLERMIQRTRGPLSSLEPVTLPVFAPVPLREQPRDGQVRVGALDQDPRADQDPHADQDHRPDRGPDELRLQVPSELLSEQRPGAWPAEGDHSDDRADPGPGPLPGTVTPALAAPAPARPTSDQPAPDPRAPGQPVPDQPPPGRFGQRWPERRTAANRRPDRHRGEPAPGPAAQPTGRTYQEAAGPREFGSGETGTPPARLAAGATGQATGSSEPGAGAEGQVGAGQPGTVTGRPRAARPAAHRRSEPQASPAPHRQAAGASSSGPDITISIGHIEVRSGPTAEKPRTQPPFRPQVSLADFLGRERRP
jgi:hypothetical protein